MNRTAFNLLRVGLAITFAWIGYLVINNPAGWATFIQPWALQYMPANVVGMMVLTGYLDIAAAIMMLIGPTVWIGALIGAVHLLIVLITCGISDITVRDVGLMFAFTALFVETMPSSIKAWIKI